LVKKGLLFLGDCWLPVAILLATGDLKNT